MHLKLLSPQFSAHSMEEKKEVWLQKKPPACEKLQQALILSVKDKAEWKRKRAMPTACARNGNRLLEVGEKGKQSRSRSCWQFKSGVGKRRVGPEPFRWEKAALGMVMVVLGDIPSGVCPPPPSALQVAIQSGHGGGFFL